MQLLERFSFILKSALFKGAFVIIGLKVLKIRLFDMLLGGFVGRFRVTIANGFDNQLMFTMQLLRPSFGDVLSVSLLLVQPLPVTSLPTSPPGSVGCWALLPFWFLPQDCLQVPLASSWHRR